MTTKEDPARRYPSCCTAAFCGRLECAGCTDKPALDEFKRWREATNAYQPDRIWSPSHWVAGPKP